MDQERIQEDEIQEEVPPETPPEVPQEVQDRARLMGHIPLEEFKGDPKRWVPADKYVERAESLMPILKSQLGKYESKILNLESTVESQRKTTEKLLKMSEKIGTQAYEQAKRELTKKQMLAVENQDVEAFEQIEKEKDLLVKPEPIEAPPEPQSSPSFDSWKGENSWYGTDPDMAMFADSYGRQYKQTNPNATYEQVLAEASKKVKNVFPHKFENPNRNIPSPVDSGGVGGGELQTGKKTFNDLPADAKVQCRKFVADQKMFLIKTNEDYVKSYFEEA
jgi:hypothetical protein